ncbi:MAG: CinA-like protein [Candidatus Kapaibacterium sp.]|nr:MAG: CinA-like protein [Candidatus Kapabacteria bacterium]
MNLYRITILSIGNEVLSGDTLNTNAAWLAARCVSLGALVVEQRTVPDHVPTIVEALADLRERCDMVITTGGLGPTHDDCTIAALIELFGDHLVLDEPTLAHLEQYAIERGRDPNSERLRSQALVPSTSQVLPNPLGTAPGLYFEPTTGAAVIVLPGVPREMKLIMEQSGFERIAAAMERRECDVVAERVLLTAGVPESELADRIEPIRRQLPSTVELAFLPSALSVRLRLRAVGKRAEVRRILDDAVSLLAPALGSAMLSDRDERLVDVLHRKCIAHGKTLAVAESCTGGMLGAEITSVPGSSSYFLGGLICYADAVKIHFGGVRPETLAQYGAVSQQTVEELARYVRAAYGSDIAVAISGIAGPSGGSDEKPVGTIWIALADERGVDARRFAFGTDRETNRVRACAAAMLMIIERLRACDG